MSVNPKDKKMMQQNWDGADEAGQDLPDGTYQFQIVNARFHMTDKSKPQFKTKVKVVGGAEEYIGTELEVNDNLETSENMGWFKKKLRKLNIAAPEDIDEIIDGDVADAMKGKTFEGQVKTKNDFMNVYVNRLTGESSGEESEAKEETEEKEETETAKSELEEGDKVEFNGKTGEVVEILADDGKARVKRDSDDVIVRVALNLLSKVEAEAEEKEEEEEAPKAKSKKKDAEEEETEEGSETFELPSADDVEDMKMPKVKEALEALGFEVDDIKTPRAVLHGICTLAEDEDAKLQMEEVAPMCEALKVKKAGNFKETSKALAKAVAKLLG
jgi:preprotein translocase subunit YajC